MKAIKENNEILEQTTTDTDENIKTNTFFKKFNPDGDSYFQISLYKIQDRNKRQWLNDYEKLIPTRNEIRDEYGAGTYWLYALDENGNLLDSCQIHIGEPVKKETHQPVQNIDRKEIINELKELVSVIQPKDGTDKELLKMIIELNARTNEKMTELIMEIKESTTKAQIETEKRMIELIKEQGTKKNDLKELLESMQILDELRGEAPKQEQNELTELIKTFLPAMQPLIANNLKITQKQNVNEFDEFKKIVTLENKDTMSKLLYEKNKHKITEQQANEIVTAILKEKGLL